MSSSPRGSQESAEPIGNASLSVDGQSDHVTSRASDEELDASSSGIIHSYATVPTQTIQFANGYESEETDEDSSEDTPPLARMVRVRRNRLVLDALLGILERNEQRMLQYVMDQSYNESLRMPTIDMDRRLDVPSVEYRTRSADCDMCMICQTAFQPGDLTPKLECSHCLHTACLDEWVKRNPVCPFCQIPIPTTEEPPLKRRRSSASLSDKDEAC